MEVVARKLKNSIEYDNVLLCKDNEDEIGYYFVISYFAGQDEQYQVPGLVNMQEAELIRLNDKEIDMLILNSLDGDVFTPIIERILDINNLEVITIYKKNKLIVKA